MFPMAVEAARLAMALRQASGLQGYLKLRDALKILCYKLSKLPGL